MKINRRTNSSQKTFDKIFLERGCGIKHLPNLPQSPFFDATHTRLHIHTLIRTLTHTGLHTHKQTHTHTLTHTHTHTYTYTHTHSFCLKISHTHTHSQSLFISLTHYSLTMSMSCLSRISFVV